ncbi:NAD(P)/FAD-dependent oxidoreductase [Nocardia macrotermitis]|uniref:Rhodocoxin reductase n=1 Tax=Nocardia macrotermitis TaxID=2585198 RepID=A0A7K0D1P7_9NOCA|nr:FAD-dependent oxidoreductase [Nocardia macrotermitis]MQY18874.1 Rhodocoxin reductase [Nocardia macrotermitis]
MTTSGRIRRTGVLVVGASVSGLNTVEALRRSGFRDRITVVGDEPHLPYDRPPLSKQILSGAWRPERTLLRAPRVLADLNIDLLLGHRALSLDPSTRTVLTTSGPITADAVVIATGATPRALPVPDGTSGVHVLRTLDDSLALRDEFAANPRVVVVGEGVLGAEISATARQSGLDVTMTGPLHAPMAAQLGDLVATQLADLHTRHGVALRLGVGVQRILGENGRVSGVRLENSQILPASVVVVAIGAIPATDWLTDSGLSLDRGVVCDATCRAADGIYAVGDVARWPGNDVNSTVRLENRTHAAEQAAVVAANILGAEDVYRPIPYFWTDQYEVKIQVHGTITPDARATVVDGDPAQGRFLVRYEREGVPTAVLGWNMPKQARMQRRILVDAQSAPGPALTSAHSS